MQPIQFFAARAEDGALLPGATVDVFVQGTQGRAPLFADSPCTVPLGNPVSADANARVFFYTTTPRIDMRISRYGYVAPLIVDISTWDAATAVEWVQAEIDAALGEIGDSLAEMEDEFVVAQNDKEQRFRDFLRSSGYEYLGDYDADGPLTVSEYNQVFRKDNELWRAKASLSLPYLTADNWVLDVTRFVSVGDAALRQELADSDGAGMLGVERHPLTVAIAMAPKIERAFLATPVSLWEHIGSVTSKPDPDDMATWDWAPAFNAMYRHIADTYSQGNLKYGKSAWIPPLSNGTYKVLGDVLIPRKGIATIGEGAQTSVIEFGVGSTATWGILAQNEAPTGNMGGTSFINIGIDCAGVAVGGLNIEDAYDNVIFDNVRISRVHKDKIGLRMGPRTDGNPGMPLSQTINARNLFVYKDGGGATVPPIVLIRVQESQFIGCKSWAGGYNGAPRGDTTAWYLEDSRSVHLLDCSAVGAQNFGVVVRAQTKSSDGIHITNMLYENCNGTLKTSSSNATTFPLKTCTHSLPRLEFPITGGYDLGGLYESIIDVGPLQATLQADTEQNRIFAQRQQNVTDLAVSSKRNVVNSHPNALDSYSGSSRELRVVRPSTPAMSLGITTSTDYAYWEYSKSDVADNGPRLGVNKGGTFIPIFRMDDTRAFLGPAVDAVYSFGTASFRGTTAFFTTGAINTSDADHKTPVRKLTTFEIAASQALGLEIGAYKWLAAVEEKGDEAREHIGMTVQRAIEIMESHGLDPFGYGFICYDEWDDSYENVEAVYEEVDGKAVLIEPEKLQLMKAAGHLYSFRMDELTLFIAAGAAAQNRMLSDRLDALEQAMT
jgi:hypothetical protein